MLTFQQMKMVMGFVGAKMPKTQYKNYEALLKQAEGVINKTAPVESCFVPTSNRIANFYGSNADVLANCQSANFINKIYELFKNKGYKLPKRSVFMEEYIPSWSGVGATCVKQEIAYNPRSIDRLNPRAVFHEFGHLLHPTLQNKNGFLVNLLRKKDKFIPFLNKNEVELLKTDYKRAYAEGLFKGMPYERWQKDKLFGLGRLTNKMLSKARKNMAERQTIYPLTDRFELIADMFSLKLQGFNFSPELEAKYVKFGGPKIEKIFTKEEIAELLKLQKSIRKKTLSDYGLSLATS